ncbi:E3 ubiquitin-protein ligase NEURL1B-like [Neocloeon triangulifer]|uniref:E3 ubiquitin-protein ligase NEURL1B-like n=1 Tax=Neocloeon triangulifer TaxID=2078957 RepID=UPI00286F957C|nr:E3 ubiquitin-protein ligase NEURL1B-like [Neocloeon triangulifer]
MENENAAPVRPLRSTGLKGKVEKLLRRKCRAPSVHELKTKLQKMDLQQVLKLNGRRVKTSSNKTKLAEEVGELLTTLDRHNAPPLPLEAAEAEQPTCAVCKDAKPDYVYSLCGHACVCGRCRVLLTNGPPHNRFSLCPICREKHRDDLVRRLHIL